MKFSPNPSASPTNPEKTKRRDGVTFSDVERAADRLKQEGIPVSLRSVRAELGTGSLSTVQRHLSTLRGSQESGPTDEGLKLSPTLSRALAADLERAVKERNAHLQAELQEAHTSIEMLLLENDTLQLSSQEALASIDSAQALAAEHSCAVNALRAQVSSLAEQLSVAKSEAEAARQSAAVVKERLHATEKGGTQLEAELRFVRQELTETRTDLTKSQKEAETSRGTAAALQFQLAAKQQLEDYLRAAVERAQGSQTELEEARQKLAGLETERTMLAERIEETRTALHRSELNVQQFMNKVLSGNSRAATIAGKKA